MNVGKTLFAQVMEQVLWKTFVRMTDGQGRTVDFKNMVIVMTANLGSQMNQ